MNSTIARNAILALASALLFVFLNCAIFAIFFFQMRGIAFDETNISSYGGFLFFPTLAEFRFEFFGISFRFFLLSSVIFLIQFFLIRLSVASIAAVSFVSTLVMFVFLANARPFFTFEREMQIADGVAVGSVSPVIAFSFTSYLSLATLVLISIIFATVKLVAILFKRN